MAAALTADSILGELQKLWASLAEGASSEQGGAVLRACAMTLIVFADEAEDPANIGQAIAEVMREHPNRAIVVRMRAGDGPFLEHRVTSQCWMPFGGQQVCCEQIEITASDASLPGLMPILLAITAPDLPVFVWCRSPRVFASPAMAALLDRAGKCILDTAEFPEVAAALGELADHSVKQRRLADLSWTRITRWREMVAEVFEDPARRDLFRFLKRVRVQYAGARPPATAYYLAAWVMTCESCGEIAAEFEPVPPVGGAIEGVVLEAPPHTVSIRRAGHDAALIEVDALKSCTEVPRLREPELLARELSISGRDPVFERTLAIAAQLARR